VNGGGPSLRRHLTVSVVGIVGASLVACSLAVYAALSRSVWRDFDARLAADAHAIALLVEEQRKGWEMEPGGLEAFERMRGPAVVEVWTADGFVLGRRPLELPDLPLPPDRPHAVFSSFTLQDGRPGRLCQAWLQPRVGHEDPVPHVWSGRKIGVAVARDVEEPVAAITRLRLLLWGPTLAVIVIAGVAASISIRNLLRHVAGLSRRVEALDSASLHARLPLDGVPGELRPPFVKLNELLSRIESSRLRERQFNSDVSHELRTPLAGLRSILEVCGSRPRSGPEYEGALHDALAVTMQMEGTVESLLMIARLGAGQARIRRDEVAVRELVDSSFAPYEPKAERRGLRFENRVPPGALLESDPDKLRLVVTNLLSNAVEYTGERGRVTVESDPDRGVVLCVRDSGPPIPAGLEEKLFDPFFRLDMARSGGGEHCGIGLSLVRALCDALGYQVTARNEADGSVAFTVSLGARERAARVGQTEDVGA
jgi:two-component system, OmpR family, heavy metal sensor histidine kinase CusS